MSKHVGIITKPPDSISLELVVFIGDKVSNRSSQLPIQELLTFQMCHRPQLPVVPLPVNKNMNCGLKNEMTELANYGVKLKREVAELERQNSTRSRSDLKEIEANFREIQEEMKLKLEEHSKALFTNNQLRFECSELIISLERGQSMLAEKDTESQRIEASLPVFDLKLSELSEQLEQMNSQLNSIAQLLMETRDAKTKKLEKLLVRAEALKKTLNSRFTSVEKLKSENRTETEKSKQIDVNIGQQKAYIISEISVRNEAQKEISRLQRAVDIETEKAQNLVACLAMRNLEKKQSEVQITTIRHRGEDEVVKAQESGKCQIEQLQSKFNKQLEGNAQEEAENDYTNHSQALELDGMNKTLQERKLKLVEHEHSYHKSGALTQSQLSDLRERFARVDSQRERHETVNAELTQGIEIHKEHIEQLNHEIESISSSSISVARELHEKMLEKDRLIYLAKNLAEGQADINHLVQMRQEAYEAGNFEHLSQLRIRENELKASIDNAQRDISALLVHRRSPADKTETTESMQLQSLKASSLLHDARLISDKLHIKLHAARQQSAKPKSAKSVSRIAVEKRKNN